MHHCATNDIHHNTEEKIKYYCIPKDLNISKSQIKYLEFLDLIARNPQ